MGKTLTTIIEIASIAALAVVTVGVGAGLAAGWSLGASIAAVGSTLGIGAAGVVSVAALGIESIATLLRKSPKPPTTYQAIKTERPARVSAYGVNRLHGAYILYATSTNGVATDCYAFHDGLLNKIRRIYLGDTIVQASNGGFVTKGIAGRWGDDVISVGWSMGHPTETAFSAVISTVPDQWTEDHRGDGVACGYALFRPVKSKHFSEVYAGGQPDQIPLSIVAECQLVYDWRDETQDFADPRTWKFSENAILHTAHYLLVRMSIGPTRPPSDPAYWSDIAGIYTARWNAKFAPSLDYWTAAANNADEPVERIAWQTALAADADDDSDHSIIVGDANGAAVGMSISVGDLSANDQVTITSVDGNKLGISPEISQLYPAGTNVNWVASDEFPITEPRYRSCVAHQHTDAHKDVLSHLLACCDGWLVTRSDGAYVIFSGQYIAPDPDDVLGPSEIISYSLQEGVNEEDAINSLKVTYVSDPLNFNTPDTDDWNQEDDISRRGKLLPDQIDNQVPSHAQARRLAKRKMAQLLAPQRGNITAFASARRFLTKRYIPIQLREGGVTYFEGVVEVEKVVRNMTTGAFSIDWHTADPNVDAWDATTDEGQPAPVGNRSIPATLDAPVILSATANFGSDVASGQPGVFLDLTVEGGDARTDLIWHVQTKSSSLVSWGNRDYEDVTPAATVDISTEFVAADAMIDVEVSYTTGDGRTSPWSATATVNTSSASIPPAKVTGFKVTGGVGTATAEWNNPNSANLAYEKTYRSASPSFSAATLIDTYADPAGTASSHAFTEIAGTWYGWCTTVSTGGVEGNPVGPVQYTVT